jgi:hypothetical protein
MSKKSNTRFSKAAAAAASFFRLLSKKPGEAGFSTAC